MGADDRPREREGWFDLAYRLATRALLVGAAAVVGILALVLVAGLPTVAWLLWEARPPSQIPFDAEDWRDPPGINTRYCMRDDLLEKHDFEGQTLVEVEGLLGHGCLDCFGSDTVAYRLGDRPWTILSFESVWLGFELGDQRRVLGHRFETRSD
jgi:hypothetical protein